MGPIGVSLPHRARDVRSVSRVHLAGSTEWRREASWPPELYGFVKESGVDLPAASTWTWRDTWQGMRPWITAAGICSILPGADLDGPCSAPGRRALGPRRHRRHHSRSARSEPDAWAARLALCSARRAIR